MKLTRSVCSFLFAMVITASAVVSADDGLRPMTPLDLARIQSMESAALSYDWSPDHGWAVDVEE